VAGLANCGGPAVEGLDARRGQWRPHAARSRRACCPRWRQ
jgi:hypothetical protein